MAAIKALEKWCKMQCDGYQDVAINNMTTSFKNGMAFCALIHKYRPDLIDYESLKKEDVFQNNHLAFRIAEEQLGIPALLDAEDMVALRVPDRLSVLTYVSQYYNYFNGRAALGCVKPPTEGSKDNPSKKNIPVVSKTFVSKTATEKAFPPSRLAESSTGTAKASSSPAEGKSGTLNSKCVACRSHVHLVQRHFVDGKLYHRSCFRCSDCSGTLRPGAYRVGSVPDTFVCKSHCDKQKNRADTLSSTATTRDPNPPVSSRSNLFQSALTTKSNGHHRHHPPPIPRPDDNPPKPVARPASVAMTPVASVTPVTPATPLTSVTPVTSPANKTADRSAPRSLSAQKTQAARRRFFETAGPAAEPPVAGWKSWKTPGPANIFSQSRGAKEKSGSGALDGSKQAQENCNNNNGRCFTVRSAKRRVEDEPSRNCGASFTQDASSWQSPARTGTEQPPNGQTSVESFCLKPIKMERTTSSKQDQKNADLTACQDWRSKLKPVEADPGRRDSNPDRPTPETIPEGSLLTVEAPQAVPGVSLLHPPCGNLLVPTRLQTISRNLAVMPVSLGCPAQSPASSPWPPANQEHQPSNGSPGSKRGKYLSHATASRTQIRSTIVTGHHIPTQQIEKELADIEAELGGLEKEGVELEKKLRSCEEDAGADILMDPVMVEWFNLIRKKQVYIRKESELVYIARTQDLELQQPGVEGELRRLLEKPDHLKSSREQDREQRLMARLVEIVNGRNAIVEVLDEDRLREVEEDQQLNKMMQNLGVRKSPKKRKSSVSKLFKRRSKRVVD